jgi:hypothetical protein
MKLGDIEKSIKETLKKTSGTYFSYAWRDMLQGVSEMLEAEGKYSRLVDWIDKEVEFCNKTKDIFSPADKDEKTTVAMVNTYCELMQKMAILIHCRLLLVDSQTTRQMRENIEYTICKLYGVHYSEELEQYL